jgi:hypothetical protein
LCLSSSEFWRSQLGFCLLFLAISWLKRLCRENMAWVNKLMAKSSYKKMAVFTDETTATWTQQITSTQVSMTT